MDLSNSLADVFRSRVREKLVEFGWNQQDLANALGVNKTYVSQLMTGHRNPGLDTIEKMSEILEVSAAWLISEKISV